MVHMTTAGAGGGHGGGGGRRGIDKTISSGWLTVNLLLQQNAGNKHLGLKVRACVSS